MAIPWRSRKPKRHSGKHSPGPFLCLFFLFILVMKTNACGGGSGQNSDEKLIGIHLGATKSQVGAVHNGQMKIFTSHEGKDYIPSYIAATDTGLVAGDAAKEIDSPNLFQAALNMNRHASEEPGLADSYPRPSPITYTTKNGRQAIQLDLNGTRKIFTPEEIYAPLFAQLRDIAESHIGPNITGTVVTIPEFFDDTDREHVRDALALANLPALRQLRESTGISIALGMDDLSYNDDIYLVLYDLGDESYDVSIVEIDMGVMDTLATARSPRLASHNYLRSVVDPLADLYEGADDLQSTEVLMPAVKEQQRVLISEPPTANDTDKVPSPSYTPETDVMEDLVNQSLTALIEILTKAKLHKENVTDVILAGKSSEIPEVHDLVRRYFKRAIIANTPLINEGAVWGAMLVSERLQEEEWLPCCCSASHPAIGIGSDDGMIEIVPQGERLPAYGTRSIPALCTSENKTLIQVYTRYVPPVDYHAMFELGDAYVPDTVVEDILLGEFELSTDCHLSEENPGIEISTLVTRQSVLRVRAVNKLTGESGMLTFPNPNSNCVNSERTSARNYTHSVETTNLEIEYERELRSLVGPGGYQKPVITTRDDYTPMMMGSSS